MLERAGVKPRASNSDAGRRSSRSSYRASVHEKYSHRQGASSRYALAFEMNGRPLPLLHGAPLLGHHSRLDGGIL